MPRVPPPGVLPLAPAVRCHFSAPGRSTDVSSRAGAEPGAFGARVRGEGTVEHHMGAQVTTRPAGEARLACCRSARARTRPRSPRCHERGLTLENVPHGAPRLACAAMRRSLTTAAAAAILLAGCGGSDNEKPSATNAPAPKKPAPPATTPAAAPKPKPKPASKRHAPPAKAIGIGEQGAAMFDAPLFRSLRIDKARRVVPWDVMQIRSEVELTDAWVAAARRAGVEPFISFGASRRNPAKLPSVAQFRAAFQAFRKRYPQVRVYAPWNEVNHKSQPTAGHPDRAAAFYEVVRAG